MITWLRDFLYKETTFLSVMRFVVILLGEGFRNGVVPTGIDHGGAAVGRFVSLAAAFITRGTKNGSPRAS